MESNSDSGLIYRAKGRFSEYTFKSTENMFITTVKFYYVYVTHERAITITYGQQTSLSGFPENVRSGPKI